MLWLKACPRCNGDLNADRDMYGPYISCLQCAHTLTEAEEVALRYSARNGRSRQMARTAQRAPAVRAPA